MPIIPTRLELRLGSTEKDRIVRAAALRGQAVSAFVRDVVLREAEATLAKPHWPERGLAAKLRGRATARLSTDEIMRLTRGA
ncbi:DUF1778 domain-containing protein [Silanimonas sp.]|uniref:type II toxin -antitoxin system TacA 1-like antitoxin n=1 Tax=Silanimonas sp. TaxID=1929290 RepID=UPI001BC02354|nr:DUF1778 domain-containing protein [Silanimonas sp.]MBS3896342.1 DUF1778 domain-containing protein [Silanimonas sp.]MBS3923651.1 DUF1778 domain-containing protein [Xanthomonadaceae bacterium]